MRHRACIAAVLVTACGTDIRLGTHRDGGGDPTTDARVIDAAPALDAASADAAVGFVEGTYALDHGPLVAVECGGSLAGMESEFSGVSAADAGLVDGILELEVQGSSVLVSGPAIEDGYGVDSVLLQHNVVPQQPPDAVFAFVDRSGSGPAGTEARFGVLGLSETEASASGAQGQSGILYTDAGSLDDGCALTFTASIDMP